MGEDNSPLYYVYIVSFVLVDNGPCALLLKNILQASSFLYICTKLPGPGYHVMYICIYKSSWQQVPCCLGPNGPHYLQLGGILQVYFEQDCAGSLDPRSTLTTQLYFFIL